eukprot:gene22775-28937_t
MECHILEILKLQNKLNRLSEMVVAFLQLLLLAESSMDVSADLMELSRTPVTVVCAGIKSILDIKRSLEVLETHGVPVLGYNCSQFPGFFTNDSASIASMMAHSRLMDLKHGLVVGVPNPSPTNADKIQYAIDFALLSAAEEGVTGAAITPYLLSRIEKLTDGSSLDSNIALVMNNARLATQIAIDYNQLVAAEYSEAKYARFFGVNPLAVQSPSSANVIARPTATEPSVKTVISSIPAVPAAAVISVSASAVGSSSTAPVPPAVTTNSNVNTTIGQSSHHDVVVVGGAVVDLIGSIHTSLARSGTSNPGTIRTTYGGVGRNIAESLARLGGDVTLATAVADDASGRNIIERARLIGIDVSNFKVLPSEDSASEDGSSSANEKRSTAVYNAIHDASGELCIGIADMSIFAEISPAYLHQLGDTIKTSKVVVSDGNISAEAFKALAGMCRQHGTSLFFEPTSDHKCLLPFEAGCIDQVDMMKPNVSELVVMASYCLSQNMVSSGRASVSNTLAAIVASRSDRAHSLDDVSIQDIRILANAIHAVMSSSSGTASAESAHKVISGKHIVVSLGARGVLWCGPSKLVAGTTSASAKNSGVVIDEQSKRGSVHIPALPLTHGTLLHTNGAGDALCGGIVSEMVTRSNLHTYRSTSSSGTSSTSSTSPLLLPDLDCIKSGLSNAHKWITSRK